ncbi:MAG: hypothetical protein R3B57_14390 [Phycisphaerales bacterium]
MIPFFLGCALMVWIPAARFRRRLLGVGIVVLGAAILIAIALAHYQLRLLRPTWYIQGMQVILYPYTAMVVAVGAFIVSIPNYRRGRCPHCAKPLDPDADEPRCRACKRSLIPVRCPNCHYDLRGHEECHDRCPECAFSFIAQAMPPRSRRSRHRHRPHEVSTALPAALATAGVGLAPREAPYRPAGQDQQWQGADQ